jgi:hypothetical protein
LSASFFCRILVLHSSIGQGSYSTSEILPNVKENNRPHYGIGIFNILKLYYDEIGKFVQRQTPKIIVPDINSPEELFLAAVFGKVTDDVNDILKDGFDE